MSLKRSILSDCRIIGVCSWKWLQNEDAFWQDETSFTVEMRMVNGIFPQKAEISELGRIHRPRCPCHRFMISSVSKISIHSKISVGSNATNVVNFTFEVYICLPYFHFDEPSSFTVRFVKIHRLLANCISL